MDTNRLLRILLLEDNDDHARLFEATMAGSVLARFETERAPDLRSGCALLTAHPFDAIVADLDLPDARGLEAVDAIGRTNPQLPLVVLSATSNMDLCLRATANGAQDFIVKGTRDVKSYDRIIMQAIERKAVMTRLEAQEAEVRTFSYGLTHDLRAQVMALEFLVDDLSGDVSDDKRRTDKPALGIQVSRLQGVVNEIGAFVEDILLYARVLDGPGEQETIDLNRIARRVVEALMPVARGRSAALQIDGTGPTLVQGDPRLLIHLVQNLVQNALVHGLRAGGTVTVSAGPVYPSHPLSPIRLAVTDNGPGVAADVRNRLFQPFQVSNVAASNVAPGHGLGLAIAMNIARRHNAILRLADVASGGAMFYVDFPAPATLVATQGGADDMPRVPAVA